MIDIKTDFEKIEELKTPCLSCMACSNLVATRTHVVFGEGNVDSPLVLVGEGPGENEDKTGRPFVGRAGQLLEKALEEAGIKRETIYITNIVKCRAADLIEGKMVNRPPTELETKNCRQWLKPQLDIIRPEVILCVGSPSAKSIIKKDFKITLERGKYFPCNFAKTAIATLHPAYILRKQTKLDDGGYSYLVQDIVRAWSTAVELREKRKGEKQKIEEINTLSHQDSLF